MRNRIEDLKRRAAEEKQADKNAGIQRINEAARLEREKIQAIVVTPEHQKLLAFANGDEVRSALKEIWDYQVGNHPIETTVNGFLGKKKKKIAQLPFKVIIKSNVDGSVNAGFEYLLSSLYSGPYRNSFEININQSGDQIRVTYVISGNDGPSTSYTFKSLEEFLDFYAKREARLL